MDSSAFSHRKGLGFMWMSSLWNAHRNANILFSDMVVAILFSSGHLLILEVTNCETRVAGKAMYACKNVEPTWVHPAAFPPAKLPGALRVCVHAHIRGLPVATNGSVPFLQDLSEWESVQCSVFGSALDWELEKLKAFRRVSKQQHTHISENTWEMRKGEIMQYVVTFGSFLFSSIREAQQERDPCNPQSLCQKQNNSWTVHESWGFRENLYEK